MVGRDWLPKRVVGQRDVFIEEYITIKDLLWDIPQAAQEHIVCSCLGEGA